MIHLLAYARCADQVQPRMYMTIAFACDFSKHQQPLGEDRSWEPRNVTCHGCLEALHARAVQLHIKGIPDQQGYPLVFDL